MKKLSKSSIDYYIFPNKIFCGIAGMWPIEEDSSTIVKIFALFRLLFALVAVNSVFVPEILLIATNWGDIKILAGVGCVLTTVGQLLFKMYYLLARRERTYRLYNEVKDLWESSSNPTERQSFESLAYWARLFTLIFYSSCMCNVFTFSIAAGVDYFKIKSDTSNSSNQDRHLPFDVWYGTDITDSPHFEVAFVCQFLASMICAAGISGLDATFVTVILHVCGQFKLINVWINKIGIEISRESFHDNYSYNLDADLLKCIRHHQRMINVVNDVNNLLTPIIFMQLLTSGIEICLSGFAVTDSSSDTNTELVKFSSYVFSMWIQLLLWCWPGEILLEESEKIGHMLYLNVPWYNLPPIYRRKFCLIIARAQRNCCISALTFQTLSIHTLTTVFNTAASYFTLLRQMQEK